MSRDPKRIPIVVRELESLWGQHPQLRFGQMLANMGRDLYFIEDDNLLALLYAFYSTHKDEGDSARQAVSPEVKDAILALLPGFDSTFHSGHTMFTLACVDTEDRYSCSCGSRFRFAEGVITETMWKLNR